MKITLNIFNDTVCELNVSDQIDLASFKAMCEQETGISRENFTLFYNRIKLDDSEKKLHEYGIKNGDCVQLAPSSYARVNFSTINNILSHVYPSISIFCQINGHKFRAHIDTGAEISIISPGLVDQCGIRNQVHRSSIDFIMGTGGSQPVIGQVSNIPILIENNEFLFGAVIIECIHDAILGIDFIRRHRCLIDMPANVFMLRSNNTRARMLTDNISSYMQFYILDTMVNLISRIGNRIVDYILSKFLRPQ